MGSRTTRWTLAGATAALALMLWVHVSSSAPASDRVAGSPDPDREGRIRRGGPSGAFHGPGFDPGPPASVRVRRSSSGTSAAMDGGTGSGAGAGAARRHSRPAGAHDAGRGRSVAASGAGSHSEPHTRPESSRDPQRHLSARTLTRAGVDSEDTFGDRDWRGRVVEADALGLEPGDTCEVRALPALAGAFNCMLRVRCEGRTVYPNEEEAGGFVLCWPKNESPTRLVDDRPTPLDGDPAIELDMEAGEVTLTDEADEGPSPYARIRLDS